MFDTLDPMQWALAAGVILAAYFVRGIAGFGSALVAVPLLALWLPLTLVVPVIVALDYLGSVSHGVGNRRHIRWGELWPLLPFTLTGIVTGLLALKQAESGVLTVALGAFVISYGLYSLLPLPELRGPRLWAAPLGFLAGLVGSVFGTGGPFTVIYLGLRGLDKLEFRGTIATIFIIDGGARLVAYLLSGFYDRETLLFALVALPVMGIGLYLGGHIHTSLSRQAFVRIVATVLLGSGIALLLK